MTDQELVAWAKDNPKDPRSAKVLAHFGGGTVMGPLPAPSGVIENKALGPPAGPAPVEGGPQDPETGLDQGQLEQTNTPGNAKAAGVVMGGLLGGASGAIPGIGAIGGGALTNMLTGYLGRAGSGQKTTAMGVGKDALIGAAVPAALKGVGAIARGLASPKVAGYGMGATTADAAESAGPSLNRVPDQAMNWMARQQTPAGATKLAGTLGQQGSEAASSSIAAGANPPSRMVDAAAQLERYATPPNLRSLVRGYVGGMFSSPVHGSFGFQPSAATAEEARYLSMMAQAAKRGIPLTPQMEAALKTMPGQTQLPSAVGAASGAYGADR